MKYSQKYGRPGNSTTHCSDTVMPYIIKTQMTDKGMRPPFPKKRDLGLAKNCQVITLTSIADKIYNALLRNRIELKIEKILKEEPKCLSEKSRHRKF